MDNFDKHTDGKLEKKWVEKGKKIFCKTITFKVFKGQTILHNIRKILTQYNCEQ